MSVAAALNILITAPSAALKADLAKNRVSVRQFRDSLRKFAEMKDPLLGLKQSLKAYKIAVRQGIISTKEFRNEKKRLKQEMAAIRNGFHSLAAAQAEGAAITHTNSTAVERHTIAMARLNKLLAAGAITQVTYDRAVVATNKDLLRQTSLLGKLGFTVSGFKAAAGIFNVWLVALGALGGAIKVGAEFGQQMQRVGAIAGTTAGEFEALKNQARSLGATTVFSAKQVSEAMESFAKAGFKTNQIMTAMMPTLRLAAIGELEMADAAEISSRIMAGMNLSAEELTGAVDAMTVGMTNSLTTIEDLGQAMKFVGPVAAQAGHGIDETVAALMLLANAGLQGEIGGTGLRNVLLKMSKPSKEAKDAMSEMNLVFKDTKGEMLGLLPVIQQFEGAMEGMGSADRLEKFNQIFEKRAAVIMAALVNAGSAEMSTFLKMLEEKEGKAEKLETVINDTLIGDFKRIWSVLTDIGIGLVDWLDGPLRGIVKALTAVLQLLQVVGTIVANMFKIMELGVLGIIGMITAVPDLIFGTDFSGGVIDEMQAVWDSMEASADRAGNTLEGAAVNIGNALGFASTIKDSTPDREAAKAELANMRSQMLVLSEEKVKQLQNDQQAIELLNEMQEKRDEIINGLKEEVKFAGLNNTMRVDLLLIENGIKDADLERVNAMRQRIQLGEQELDLQDSIKNAAEEIMFFDKKSGEIAIMKAKLAGATGAQLEEITNAANFLDKLNGQKDLLEQIKGLKEDKTKASDDLFDAGSDQDQKDMKELLDARQAGLDAGANNAQLDKIAQTIQETQELRRQTEEVKKRLKAEEDLRKKRLKSGEDVKKFAEGIADKLDPLRNFRRDISKINAANQAGILSDEQAKQAKAELRASTLKSGASNQSVAALEKGSVAAFQAELGGRKNPQLAILEKQLALEEAGAIVKQQTKTALENLNTFLEEEREIE